MLEATFLGHQGWLLSTGATTVLVDPLLTEGFGHGGGAGTVFPPRHFDFERFPQVDAVIITHEHDDHFDIPSLASLERRIPLFVSGRSSAAMHEFVRGMGFEVHPLEPGRSYPIGDLSYRTFAADHTATPLADEWDVFPYLITDAQGEGAFASSVDVRMPASMVDALGSVSGWPGMLCLANNVTDTRFTLRDATQLQRRDDTEAMAGVLERRWKSLSQRAGAPRITAICGGGWSHPADMSWIDDVAFPVDSDGLASRLRSTCGARFDAARPGQTFRLDRAGVRASVASFIEINGEGVRPARATVDVVRDYAPACGRHRLETDDLTRLLAGLSEFARFLFARPVFAGVHSLATDAALAFSLRDEAGPLTLVYAPAEAGFRPAQVDHAVSGYECWATDLLALLEGELGPTALCYTGRLRCWNGEPERLRVSPHDLWLFAQPLHRPHVARRLYESLYQGVAEPNVTSVSFRSAPRG